MLRVGRQRRCTGGRLLVRWQGVVEWECSAPDDRAQDPCHSDRRLRREFFGEVDRSCFELTDRMDLVTNPMASAVGPSIFLAAG